MRVAHCTAVKTGVVELHVHHQTRELANVLLSPGCRGCDATVGTGRFFILFECIKQPIQNKNIFSILH